MLTATIARVPEVYGNYFLEVFCVLFFKKDFVKNILCFEKSFIICFEKCVRNGTHLKIYLNNLFENSFQHLINEKSFAKL